MTEEPISQDQREFRCNHCSGRIVIPMSLPSTTGPCPHCGAIIISPGPPAAAAPQGKVQAMPAASPAEQRASAPDVATVPEPQAPKVKVPRKSSKAFLAALGVTAILLGGAGIAIYFMARQMGRNVSVGTSAPAVDPAVLENQYLRVGWQKDALKVLKRFIVADTPEKKAAESIGGKDAISKMDAFYGGGRIDDTDTPADAFSAFELPMEDRKRGLFMMVYDQAAQFNMKEFFRPLASLEVQYEVEEPDILLGSFAWGSNFAMEPVKIHAFFKRAPGGGLKLDWDTFVQGKYRMFRNFLDLPENGRSSVFRLLVVEDMPDRGTDTEGYKTYRIVDSANPADSALVNVPVDSEVGRALSVINWRGVKDATPKTRTVTLQLSWEGDHTPELRISKFICWEFLGLGGDESAKPRK